MADNNGKSFSYFLVKIGFWALGKAAMHACRVDKKLRKELDNWPEGFTVMLSVLPSGPTVAWRKEKDRFKYLGLNKNISADLTVNIKSLKAAVRMITAQLGIAQAYAFRRIAIEGNTVDAMVLTRILDRVEAYLFPRFLSKNLLKKVPVFGLREYWNNLLIYLSLPL